jgi:hypothetical protein
MPLSAGAEVVDCRARSRSKAAYGTQFWSNHAAIAVPITEAQIREVAEREGWRVVACDRRAFSLIELWIENRFLLELLTPELSGKYLAFSQQPQLVEQVFGAPIMNYSPVPSSVG